jgi:hypothetical protein
MIDLIMACGFVWRIMASWRVVPGEEVGSRPGEVGIDDCLWDAANFMSAACGVVRGEGNGMPRSHHRAEVIENGKELTCEGSHFVLEKITVSLIKMKLLLDRINESVRRAKVWPDISVMRERGRL